MHQRKVIQWGGCLCSCFVWFYKAREVESKPPQVHLHHCTVSAGAVTLTLMYNHSQRWREHSTFCHVSDTFHCRAKQRQMKWEVGVMNHLKRNSTHRPHCKKNDGVAARSAASRWERSHHSSGQAEGRHAFLELRPAPSFINRPRHLELGLL